ncbi:MAG: uroporphyrinogen decarboxylase family protein [Betaproteobacteria bacterium]|nr:uroporphyrinogen decarboxylase family protein [Betaproteobacteria bacterium]
MYDKGRMTSRERLYTAMALKEPDRVPILPNTRAFGVHDLGYTLEDCFKDGKKYVRSQVRMVTDYANDAVWSMYEMPVERALGQKMSTPSDDQPSPLAPLLNSPEDLANLPKNLVLKGKGWTDYLLDITKGLKKSVGDEVPVMGFVPSPFRQACILRGTENLYMDMYENPGFVKELLEYLIEPSNQFVELQAEVGADIIFCGCPVAGRSCISREFYEEFVHPNHVEVFDYWKNTLDLKILFHPCGDWSDRFDLVVEEAPDIIHVDKIDLAWLKKAYGGKVCINGKVGTTSTLLLGTPEQVKQEAKECIAKAAAGGGFALGADCGVPRDTPAANMHAMTEAVMEAGSYPFK